MRFSSRLVASALLAASMVLAGFSGPAAAEEATPTPAVPTVLALTSPAPAAPAPAPVVKPAPKPVAKKPAPKPTRAQNVIKWAAKQKGKPYRYGAKGPKSFDCSGFVQYVYNKAGKKIGRTSGAQLKGKKIKKSNKKAGDILVFIKNGRAYHSAIYAGGGKMWEAQKSGTRVGKHKIWSSGYVVRRP